MPPIFGRGQENKLYKKWVVFLTLKKKEAAKKIEKKRPAKAHSPVRLLGSRMKKIMQKKNTIPEIYVLLSTSTNRSESQQVEKRIAGEGGGQHVVGQL